MTHNDILQKAQFTLRERVSIVIPGTRDVNHAADNTAIVKRVAGQFAALFGGASVQDITGYWIDNAGALVEESNREVYAYCNRAIESAGAVLDIAAAIKSELTQEAVLVTINGEAHFI